MRAHDLTNLGDEPLYTKTVDDEVFYSGSEDDYYEGPEVRRMRIEAKAVQFLNGNTPYLLSASLRGPFDAKSWNNPWKSKRAQCQATRLASQLRPSINTAEAVRSSASTKAIDGQTDTQRTSLFPLPSPEITNPPSIRANQYLADEEYSRIKTWRETVKKVPLSTDPFWKSYQEGSQRSTATRKRYGEQDWLHKRDTKKRKSEDSRHLPQAESPSQAAAQHRESQLLGRLAESVTHSAPGSFTNGDELAAQWGRAMAIFHTSPMAKMRPKTTVLQTGHKQQSRPKQASVHCSGLSDDEPSIPSVAPSRSGSRPPFKSTLGAILNHSSERQKKTADNGPAVQITCDQVNEAQVTNDETGPARAATSHEPVRNIASKFVKTLTRKAVGVSQQDDSFHFHQARPKRRSSEEVPLVDQMDGTTLSLRASQNTAAVTTQTLTKERNESNRKIDSVPVPSSLNDQTAKHTNDVQEAPLEAGPEVTMTDEAGTSTLAAPLPKAPVPGQSQDLLISTNTKFDRSKPSCTQELSPVSMQDRPQTNVPSALHSEDCPSIHSQRCDDADASNGEWSTYVNSQDVSHDSQQLPTIVKVVEPAGATSQDAADPDDSEWTTYLNTQDVTAPATENDMALESANGVQVVVQDPGDASDPEWSTFINTQDLSATHMQLEAPSAVQIEQAEKHQQEVAKADENEDIEANSNSSSYRSASSGADAEDTGNTSNEPVSINTSAMATKHSQDTVGGIIDGYADNDASLEEFEDCQESQTPFEQQNEMVANIQPSGEVLEAERLEVEIAFFPDASQDRSHDISPPTAASGPIEPPMDLYEHAAVGLDASTATLESQDPPTSAAPIPSDSTFNTPVEPTEPSVGPTGGSAIEFDGTTVSLENPSVEAEAATVQSPWAKGPMALPLPTILNGDPTVNKSSSEFSLLAGQALAFPPAPQTPWLGDRLPSPNFTLSVKRFSDFMKVSPQKRRVSANGSILRNSDSTSRVLFGAPVPVKPKRQVTFAPLPGDEDIAVAGMESIGKENVSKEDISYFDANGNKTTSIRITRSHTRAASPPPSEVNITEVNQLPDYDDKFARHFEVMSTRKKHPPRKMQRLLPTESQQTNGSQAIDAMAEAFIQASQTRKKACELIDDVDNSSRPSQASPERLVSPTAKNVEERELVEPVDDVSAVLDNIDDFLDNSWGFNTRADVELEEEASTKQQADVLRSRLANVDDPIFAMHANVWAD